MNASQILDEVRSRGAELLVRDGTLVVRGSGPALPKELQASIRERKAELMVVLGTPIDETVASILKDIRPHLAPALQKQPDSSLLVLVNWSILHAWCKAVREISNQHHP